MNDKHRALRDTPQVPTMLAGPVAGTVFFAMARGVPMARITEATGLRAEDLVNLDGRLPERHMPVLWRLLAETFPGQAVAIEMAASVPQSFMGVLMHGTRYAETLGAGIQTFLRYSGVVSTQLRCALVMGIREVRFEIHHPLDAEDDGHASELGMGFFVRYLRDVLGIDDVLLRVELGHEPFGPPRAYEEYFRVPVRFGAAGNAMILHPGALRRPLPERNAPALRYVVAHLELVRERQAASATDPELARMRDAIGHNAERGEYGAEPLARKLGTSLRSLQRMASRHGTSLRELIDEAREANARELLGDSRLSVAEVAFLLGYATESSFRRAYKRWTGQSPRARASASPPATAGR